MDEEGGAHAVGGCSGAVSRCGLLKPGDGGHVVHFLVQLVGGGDAMETVHGNVITWVTDGSDMSSLLHHAGISRNLVGGTVREV